MCVCICKENGHSTGCWRAFPTEYIMNTDKIALCVIITMIYLASE